MVTNVSKSIGGRPHTARWVRKRMEQGLNLDGWQRGKDGEDEETEPVAESSEFDELMRALG